MSRELRLPRCGLESFFGLKACAYDPLEFMDFRGNQISSFEHFGTHNDLVELHLEDNNIATLQGLTGQTRLERVYIAGNPIASNPHLRVMVLLTVGFSLKFVDSVEIGPNERETARLLGPCAALCVSYGWSLDLMPRSVADYDLIISALRVQRRKKLGGPQQRSVFAVLNEQTQIPVTECSHNSENVVIQHLSQRVVDLEHELRVTKLLLQEAMAKESTHLCPISSNDDLQLSHLEWTTPEVVRFHSCALSSNLKFLFGPSGVNQQPVNCSLSIEQCRLSFVKPFSLAKLAEVEVSTVVEVLIDKAELQLIVKTASGAVFIVETPDEATLSAILKVLHLRNGIKCSNPGELQKAEVHRSRIDIETASSGNCTGASVEPQPSVLPQALTKDNTAVAKSELQIATQKDGKPTSSSVEPQPSALPQALTKNNTAVASNAKQSHNQLGVGVVGVNQTRAFRRVDLKMLSIDSESD